MKNAAGTVVGTGNLSSGQSDGAGTCNFTFSVSGVPESEFYAIEVSHRGSMTYSVDDVRDGKVSLSLG
jgi:hypothetical protein